MILILKNSEVYALWTLLTTVEFTLVVLLGLAALECARWAKRNEQFDAKFLEPGWDKDTVAPDAVDVKYQGKVQNCPPIVGRHPQCPQEPYVRCDYPQCDGIGCPVFTVNHQSISANQVEQTKRKTV